MAKTYEVWTKSNSLYYIKEDAGRFYVRKPGHGHPGQSSSLQGAIAIVEAHSGSKVKSID